MARPGQSPQTDLHGATQEGKGAGRGHWRRAVPCPRTAISKCLDPVCPTPTFPLFDRHPRATYGGALEPEEARRVLAEHDLLLFLSYMRSEGTPGVIIEAFQCGVPVIATSIGGVPEQVEHEKKRVAGGASLRPGVEGGDPALIDDPALYRRLCAGAKQRGEFFRGGRHFDRLAEELRGLARR